MNIPVTDNFSGKPFLKWAGGKSQLIQHIEKALPHDIHTKRNLTYIEPFIGSGAVMFWFLKSFSNVKKAVINDVNPALANAYAVIKDEPHSLIRVLKIIQNKYYSLNSEKDRKDFFLDKREEFNARKSTPLKNTALLVFLNRTCYNGLYRVNSHNKFNVPFGKYSKPRICDPETIIADSAILQKVIILNGDYADTIKHATKNTFFYFDPPYKPISKTASFNSYSGNHFDDKEQTRLKNFCDQLNSKNYQWLLSNSDPKNINSENNFFENLYDKSVFIDRVKAKRTINSDAAGRGKISELLISNYAKNNMQVF